MNIRYLRVSTRHQNHIREIYLLDNLGIQFDKTYSDVCTGAHTNRRGLQSLLKEVNSGDTVYCESVSRLSRNINDLISIVDKLVSNGVRIVFVRENIDTIKPNYKYLLKTFGALVEIEREEISKRTKEKFDALKQIRESTGEVATKSGRWFGGNLKEKADLPAEFEIVYLKIKNKSLTKNEAAKVLKIGRTTLYRWVALYEGSNKRYR